MELNYISHLERELEDSKGKRKRERTRIKLKISIARVLSDRGYHAMRLSDATADAEIAESGIYFYFKDRSEAIRSVLLEFLEDFMQGHVDEKVRQIPRHGNESPFDRLRASIIIWIKLARVNAGLMRCLVQMSDDDPTFRAASQRYNMRWITRVSERVLRFRERSDNDVAAVYTYAVSIMFDELVSRLCAYGDDSFNDTLDRLGDRDEVLADVISMIWMRVLYPEASFPADDNKAHPQVINWATNKLLGQSERDKGKARVVRAVKRRNTV